MFLGLFLWLVVMLFLRQRPGFHDVAVIGRPRAQLPLRFSRRELC